LSHSIKINLAENDPWSCIVNKKE